MARPKSDEKRVPLNTTIPCELSDKLKTHLAARRPKVAQNEAVSIAIEEWLLREIEKEASK